MMRPVSLFGLVPPKQHDIIVVTGCPCLIPEVNRNAFSVSPVNVMLVLVSHIYILLSCKSIKSIPILTVFVFKLGLDIGFLSNTSLASNEIFIWYFSCNHV